MRPTQAVGTRGFLPSGWGILEGTDCSKFLRISARCWPGEAGSEGKPRPDCFCSPGPFEPPRPDCQDGNSGPQPVGRPKRARLGRPSFESISGAKVAGVSVFMESGLART